MENISKGVYLSDMMPYRKFSRSLEATRFVLNIAR